MKSSLHTSLDWPIFSLKFLTNLSFVSKLRRVFAINTKLYTGGNVTTILCVLICQRSHHNCACLLLWCMNGIDPSADLYIFSFIDLIPSTGSKFRTVNWPTYPHILVQTHYDVLNHKENRWWIHLPSPVHNS